MHENTTIKTEIVGFINNNFLMGSNLVKFNDDDSFLEKGIIDSTGVLEMVNFIQSNFGISVEDAELVPENLDSINRITDYIVRKKANCA
ncbi:acyl carrier protein [Chitinispirillales bacterium ANBcel5]|uniref:acyl carrier protein n=1 Tax=Cellulosispirillum alkaliphilum TaxID=3039283 RepID=UPI002A4F3D6E|nr:acyl carrier protein [Chitinispirillales bacterium ANBcel5]